MDLDIYSDKLEELGEQIDSLVNKFLHGATQETADALCMHFEQYADVISNIPEFVNLNHAIHQLSSIFTHINFDQDVHEYFDLLAGISRELDKWRISIFDSKDADNIHYLDQSLISDCMMLEQLISGDNDEDGDMEFF